MYMLKLFAFYCFLTNPTLPLLQFVAPFLYTRALLDSRQGLIPGTKYGPVLVLLAGQEI